MHKPKNNQRILIYRLGSLGDTVVALPAMRLVERSFPDAERWLLTNYSISTNAAPMAQVLDGTGLVHGYIEYPLGSRDLSVLLKLRNTIKQLGADTLIYMAAPRGRLKLLRDMAYFWACGIRRFIGMPYSKTTQKPLKLTPELYEYQGVRLLRCLRTRLGSMNIGASASFDLCLNEKERTSAQSILALVGNKKPLIAASIGAKTEVQDWGNENWHALICKLSRLYEGAGLLLLGTESEYERSDTLLRQWKGVGMNLCGQLTVRESAALLEQASIFIGHDSGPMHLAAAVDTACVAIFSSRNLPGEWFPYGHKHKVLYKNVDCQGCRLDVCVDRRKYCIRSISVDDVTEKIGSILNI